MWHLDEGGHMTPNHQGCEDVVDVHILCCNEVAATLLGVSVEPPRNLLFFSIHSDSACWRVAGVAIFKYRWRFAQISR